MFFKVFNGYRPPMPVGMPRGLQALLAACWAHDPAERPSFASIVTRLQRLVREVRAPAVLLPPCQLLPSPPCLRRLRCKAYPLSHV